MYFDKMKDFALIDAQITRKNNALQKFMKLKALEM